MPAPAHVLVLDIGKTNAKLALVDTASLAEIEVLTQPNRVLPGPPYPHADAEGIWAFLCAGARALHARHGVDAVVATTHACAAALLDADGRLALPILDYEHDGPDSLAAAYDEIRPDFAETGSPRLPLGLNLGAQLFWQFRAFPEAAARVRTIVTYPQYWAFRLSGVAALEATSLGAHSDLWNPRARAFSSLVEAEGWRPRMAPVRSRRRPPRADHRRTRPTPPASRPAPRSSAASTIPTPRCCRISAPAPPRSPWSRPAPG